MHMPHRVHAALAQIIAATVLIAGISPAFAANKGFFRINLPPKIVGSAVTSVDAGKPYFFQPTASDANGDTLRFSISGRPAWALFNTATGALTGTPTAENVGTYANIVISVTDGRRKSPWVSLPAFSITVKAATNAAPTIAGAPVTQASTQTAYSFVPSASDPEGASLTFGIANKPAWASFSTATGALTGTPTAAGTFAGIVISVTDGTNTVSLPAFSVTVQAPNRAPTISGTPGTSATVGQAYSFQPTATDADGNTLTFAIANRPAWASFNTATGQLSGTPASAYGGTTASNIVISVSDGTVSTALPAFAISVAAPPATGTVTLSWTPPTTNSDGTPLTDLAGYRIVYGQASRTYTQSLTIGAPSVASAMIEGLAQGTWFFAVKAYTAAGVESDLSNEASKTIL